MPLAGLARQHFGAQAVAGLGNKILSARAITMPATIAATKIGRLRMAEPKGRNGAARTKAGNAPADPEQRGAADQFAIDPP